jgi:branched-chain amino acid transport system ATP-binding protein
LPTLLIDHDMSLVFGICDYVYVLDFGTLIAQGTPETVREDERVLSAYLGSAALQAAPGPASSKAPSGNGKEAT